MMKKYVTPALKVENFNVNESVLLGSEINTSISDGGAAKETFGVWVDEDEDVE